MSTHIVSREMASPSTGPMHLRSSSGHHLRSTSRFAPAIRTRTIARIRSISAVRAMQPTESRHFAFPFTTSATFSGSNLHLQLLQHRQMHLDHDASEDSDVLGIVSCQN